MREYFMSCKTDDDGRLAPAQEENEAGRKIDRKKCLILAGE